jgi:Ca-activated chloride channel family protein
VSFGHREFLWLLLLVPALGAWSIRDERLREEIWRSLSQRGTALPGRSFGMLMASLLLILALARPRFGAVALEPLPPGHDVTIVVDVSRSMAVEDAVPNRLAVAVGAAESLIAALASDPANRAAIVAFAGRGVIRYPLTENLGAVIDELHRLAPGSVQPGSTDLAAGLDAALETFGEEEHKDGRSIVIFSDGEDLGGHWQSRLDRLAGAGVVVHAVAIGDAERGHPVPAASGDQPLSYQGQPVVSQRIDTALEAITRRTGGALVRLGLASTDVGSLYRARIAPVAKIKRATARAAERAERFPLFLAAALGFALWGCWPAGWIGPWRWLWGRLAAVLVLGSGLLMVLGAGQDVGQDIKEPRGIPLRNSSYDHSSGCLGQSEAMPHSPGPPHPAFGHLLPWGEGAAQRRIRGRPGAPSTPPQPPDSRQWATGKLTTAELVGNGNAAYAAGLLADALAAFEAAIDRAPEGPIPRYNAAATLFAMGRYDEAIGRYAEARQRAGPILRTKIDFALGNSSLMAGDLQKAVEHYDNCLASTATGDALGAVRQDAAINRKFALEQAPSAMAPESQRDRQESSPKQRPGGPGARKGGHGDDERPEADSADSQTEGSGTPSETILDDRGALRRRRTGGAGGSSKALSGSPRASPDDRLDLALELIRDAQRRRLPEETSPAPSGDGRKDW